MSNRKVSHILVIIAAALFAFSAYAMGGKNKSDQSPQSTDQTSQEQQPGMASPGVAQSDQGMISGTSPSGRPEQYGSTTEGSMSQGSPSGEAAGTAGSEPDSGASGN